MRRSVKTPPARAGGVFTVEPQPPQHASVLVVAQMLATVSSEFLPPLGLIPPLTDPASFAFFGERVFALSESLSPCFLSAMEPSE